MEFDIIKTQDGSFTLYNKKFKDFYHSTSGAISESIHIYINNGLKKINKKNITVFEVGFGTGLNVLLTYIYALQNNLYINYFAVEKYPLPSNIIEQLQLPEPVAGYYDIFKILHDNKWNKFINISEKFTLKKIRNDIIFFEPNFKFDLCYYDAFSYDSQPELWTEEIFIKIFKAMNPGGIFVTYSAKGIVKQNLRQAGFEVKRIKGFGKKWHNLIAIKNS